MFHHFHDDRHPAGPGSLSAEELATLIRFLDPARLLPARDWLGRALGGTLNDNDLCLTFDDSLRCQYDVALPVLREFGLTAFWFVPTSALQGDLPRLELYRAFRVRCFEEVDGFYEAFFRYLATSRYAGPVEQALRGFHPGTYLAEFPFYSEADRRFRYVRDEVLGQQRYERTMDALISSMGIELEELAQDLWMDGSSVRELHADGHVIGLHTHTHPTRLAALPPQEQLREYRDNYMSLMALLGQPPATAAHPCNSYDEQTLDILRRLGVKVGFRANMAQPAHSELEFPREDHANVARQMRGGAARYASPVGLVTLR